MHGKANQTQTNNLKFTFGFRILWPSLKPHLDSFYVLQRSFLFQTNLYSYLQLQASKLPKDWTVLYCVRSSFHLQWKMPGFRIQKIQSIFITLNVNYIFYVLWVKNKIKRKEKSEKFQSFTGCFLPKRKEDQKVRVLKNV